MKSILWKAKFGVKLLKVKIIGRYIPFQVQFSITDKCNLNCNYCYIKNPCGKYRDLQTKDVFKIIDELAVLGTKRINLIGGEPLLRNDIGEIITYIKENNMECAMTSNGYLVPNKVNIVKNLDLLCISLDGRKEANDKNRGNGSYENALNAIEAAKEHKIPLQVSTVLTKDSIDSIEYILNEAKENNYAVGFTTLVNKNNEILSTYLPTDEETREVLGKIIDMKRKGYPVLFSQKTLQYARNWPYSYQEDKIIGKEPEHKYIKCFAGKYFAFIDTNGDIYPCSFLIGIIKPQNCLDMGIKKSFLSINNHNCKTCHFPCQNEFNLIYSMDPLALINAIINYKR